MSAYFVPEFWPESGEQERALEQRLEAEFLFDDKVVNLVVGNEAPAPMALRERMFRELAGWIAFEDLITDLRAGAILLAAWSLLCRLDLGLLSLLVLAFVVMQLVNGVRTIRSLAHARALADLLTAVHELQQPTWTMLVSALERMATVFFRLRARGLVAALLTLAGVFDLWSRRGGLFALISFAVILLTTVLLAMGNMGRVRQTLAAATYAPAGRSAEELAAVIDRALSRLDADIHTWYARTAMRPQVGTPLNVPKRTTVWLSAFDVEFGLVALGLVSAGVLRGRDFVAWGYAPLREGGPNSLLLVISAMLALTLLGVRRLSGYARGTHFRSVILRRFSVQSDLLTRRVTAPILAACGEARVVVPRALALADEGTQGPLRSKGLRRGWFEKLVDAHIKAEVDDSAPTKVGAFLIPRGTFAYAETVTFEDEAWQAGVVALLRTADAAVIDVTDFSDSVAFEVRAALAALPTERIVLIVDRRQMWRVDTVLEAQGDRLSAFPHVLGYDVGLRGRFALRWRLCRLVRRMR